MISPDATTPKARRWRRRVAWLVILLALLAVATLSTSPSVPAVPPPNSAQVRAAKQVFDRLRRVADSNRPGEVALSWAEASNAAGLAGQASNIPNVAVSGTTAMATLRASVPVVRGLWINTEGYAEPNVEGFPVVSARIGHLPIPAVLTRAVLDLGRTVLGWRGINLPALDAVVQSVTFSEAGFIARVTVPRNSELYATLNRAQGEPIDTGAVVTVYCRLAREQRATIAPNLATQVRRAFADQAPAAAQNRAALVALAMFTVSPDVGNLAGDAAAQIKSCQIGPQELTLLGRADLAKHWTMSAALTAAYGAGLSQAMGTWKEVSDSGPTGTGFSFIDLSADRSGIRVGTRAAAPETAVATAQRLRSITEGDLLPIKALAFAEGLTEAEFSKHYADIESARYDAMVKRIDRVLGNIDTQ
jgi:hypothetical protein